MRYLQSVKQQPMQLREGTVVIVRMGKLGANVNTYSMVVKEMTFLGSTGGSVEDLQGVYDCFATIK